MATAAPAKPKEDQKSDGDLKKVKVVWEGDQITLPEGLSYDDARRALSLIEKEENTVVNTSEVIKAFPLDGAVAFHRVLSELYGWTNLLPTPGFWGDTPPRMISVEVGYNETIQVPWGNCKVPKIDGVLTTAFAVDEGMPVFRLVGEVMRKDEKALLRIAAAVRKKVAEDSIYRGKAIKVNFRDSNGERREFDPGFAPRFIDQQANRQEAIYSKEVERTIQTNLFNPVMYTDQCRKQGIPLKRGILLEGPYGTGKTLTAYKLARLCTANGWTFLYLEDVRDLDMAIGFAKLYEPCVLFAEDVDRTTSGGRDVHLDKILNTLDGVESKDREIMVVLTTNHLNYINPAFVRPGRIDTIVQITPPDSDATVRMVRRYGTDKSGKETLDPTVTDTQLSETVVKLVGANAAFVREVVERAKLSAIAKCEEHGMLITANDISAAVDTMLPHIKLLNPEHGVVKDGPQIHPIEMMFEVIVEMVTTAMINKIANPSTLAKMLKPVPKRGL